MRESIFLPGKKTAAGLAAAAGLAGALYHGEGNKVDDAVEADRVTDVSEGSTTPTVQFNEEETFVASPEQMTIEEEETLDAVLDILSRLEGGYSGGKTVNGDLEIKTPEGLSLGGVRIDPETGEYVFTVDEDIIRYMRDFDAYGKIEPVTFSDPEEMQGIIYEAESLRYSVNDGVRRVSIGTELTQNTYIITDEIRIAREEDAEEAARNLAADIHEAEVEAARRAEVDTGDF